MRVRSFGLATLALGILIGAGGCSSESPTSSLAPAGHSASKKDTRWNDTTPTLTTQGSAYAGSGSRVDAPAANSAYAGSGS